MTREEAIKELKIIREDYWDEYEDPMPALDMAIKALEQQPEDAISRAETVQFLTNHSMDFEDTKIRMAFKTASSLVNNPHNLPPVQPKYNTSEWCHDCKEYDQNKHCCPRFNRVIRNTIDEMKHEKIKTGHWIDNHTTCDCCGWQMIDDVMESPNMVFFPFCPNCGAKMVKPQESEEP